MLAFTILVALVPLLVSAHAHHDQIPLVGKNTPLDISQEPWASKYGAQQDLSYTGPLSFSHLPYTRCLEDATRAFDIAILGFPFDTTVTYRPGARFGPFAIRSGSRRQNGKGWTLAWNTGLAELGSGMVDCGDVPLTPFDNAKAIDQMEAAYSSLLDRPVYGGEPGTAYKSRTASLAKDGKEHPRLVTLGGDHTIVLPILRSLHKVYGPISVIHFDAHMDTGGPDWKIEDTVTHGSYFAVAQYEHLITNTSIHGGIRSKMGGTENVEHDESVGFQVISTEDIDDWGINQVIKTIRSRVGTGPVYFSLDIDVIDPGFAPATGTPEAGGWTVREVKRIIRGLSGLNFVGADVVEVAPAYDHADVTGIVAADIVHDFLVMMQSDGPPPVHVGPFAKADRDL
ncbi:hypothetical protein PLICRDRAFT_268293 [Plicaturopsis crispa FD-325 SS-3]|nr:hypothetical protein PLICRDRAFT_268293 [Plicaturopsis crispa FD-325 SS-3]